MITSTFIQRFSLFRGTVIIVKLNIEWSSHNYSACTGMQQASYHISTRRVQELLHLALRPSAIVPVPSLLASVNYYIIIHNKNCVKGIIFGFHKKQCQVYYIVIARNLPISSITVLVFTTSPLPSVTLHVCIPASDNFKISMVTEADL